MKTSASPPPPAGGRRFALAILGCCGCCRSGEVVVVRASFHQHHHHHRRRHHHHRRRRHHHHPPVVSSHLPLGGGESTTIEERGGACASGRVIRRPPGLPPIRSHPPSPTLLRASSSDSREEEGEDDDDGIVVVVASRDERRRRRPAFGTYDAHRDDRDDRRTPPPLPFLSWRDLSPLSLHAAACLSAAIVVSTYEDYDVTHTRPSPSTLRPLPTKTTTTTAVRGSSSWPAVPARLDFLGAATRGMGWGPADRGVAGGGGGGRAAVFSVDGAGDLDDDGYDGRDGEASSFGGWYGDGAESLRWKPSYNEIMLRHRSERVPRWREDPSGQRARRTSTSSSEEDATAAAATTAASSEERSRGAVAMLYASIGELDELKAMADEYMWEEMRGYLEPPPPAAATATTDSARASGPTGEGGGGRSLHAALEYSMDVLRTTAAPSIRSSSGGGVGRPRGGGGGGGEYVGELPGLIGFDWGSCAWRHCGARADAQEAVAELYSNVGMLEPFECRFIIDVVERSIRDVLAVVPDDLKPHQDGILVQLKPYEPYVPKGDSNNDGLGVDYEYTQALSELRIDLSEE